MKWIDRFGEESLCRFYKDTSSRDEEFASNEITFNKQTYTEFVGIIIDITSSELA